MKRGNYITNNRKFLVYTDVLKKLKNKGLTNCGLCYLFIYSQRDIFGEPLFKFKQFTEIYKRRPSIRQIERHYGFWFTDFMGYGDFRRKQIVKAALKEVEYAIHGE